MQALFYGIRSCRNRNNCCEQLQAFKKKLGKDVLLWIIALVLAVMTYITEKEIIWLILGGVLIVWLYRRRTKIKISSNNIFLFPFLLQVTMM
jgi:chromate transporter